MNKMKMQIESALLLAVPITGLMLANPIVGQTFTTLHSFTGTTNDSSLNYYMPYTNGDGAVPNSGLVLSGNTLYGTAYEGGTGAVGTVFAVNTDGSGFTTLLNFTFGTSDGYSPYGGLVLSGNTLYGT